MSGSVSRARPSSSAAAGKAVKPPSCGSAGRSGPVPGQPATPAVLRPAEDKPALHARKRYLPVVAQDEPERGKHPTLLPGAGGLPNEAHLSALVERGGVRVGVDDACSEATVLGTVDGVAHQATSKSLAQHAGVDEQGHTAPRRGCRGRPARRSQPGSGRCRPLQRRSERSR